MNRPKASRLKLAVVVAAFAAFAAFAPAAGADVSSSVTGEFSNTVPGGHGDYTNTQTFTYDTYGTEDLRKWVIDGPAGLIGNPNSIPYEDRCTLAEFNTTIDPGNDSTPPFFNACPQSSKVGIAAVNLALDANDSSYDANGAQNIPGGRLTGNIQDFGNIYLASTFNNGVEFANLPSTYNDATPGTIFILQTDPEVPTTLATFFYLTGNRTQSVLAPVTNLSAGNNGDSDFRIRTVPQDDITPTGGVHINGILQHLNGLTQASEPFLTNPLRCDDWTTYSYADKVGGNTGGTDAPVDGEGTVFRKSAGDDVTPDCSGALPALNATGTATVTTGARGANPGLKVTIADPTAADDDQPKKVSVTLPSTITNDTDSLVNVCSIAERDAENCPANTKVGTATVQTPLISAGLTGTVYKTTGTNGNLPNLSIFVDGAIKFRLDATNEFTGASFNQIKSTFDNLPQSPFTSFEVNIDGGASDSLLLNRTCPTDGSAPDDGPISFAINGYTGAASSSSSGVGFEPCYGVSKPSNLQYCQTVTKKLKVSPKGLVAVNNIANVKLFTGAKTTSMNKRATDSKSPHKFEVTLKKDTYKKGKTYYYLYKVEYKDGKILKTQTGKFKTCK